MSTFPTPAIYYLPDGFSLGDERIMGRQAAGAAFLKALAGEKPERLFCYTAKRQSVDQFSTAIRRHGSDSTAIEWLPLPAHRRLGEAGLLYVPDPGLAPFAWRRARHAPRSYSLCGITHTLMSHAAMELLASMTLSPLEHWDALICTSRAVRQSVDHLLAVQADFLKRRFGARRMPIPQLPIIPLGVDCGNFNFKEGERQKARQMLGIDDDEIVLLYVGRLSFHAKAHHLPMLLAAEQASKGHKVVLLQAGWFAHEKIEAIYQTEGAKFAPSLRRIFVDGRKAKDLRAAWAAGDIFTSLTDNFQETFGLTPIEAMASGMPVVVSDWDGYKDSVRDGIDGFRIPTLTLPPGSAEFLVERADFSFDNYDTYCGLTSLLIAVDVKATTDAYRKLFSDPNLRQQMGNSGKKRAREDYDWSKIIGLYGQLWAELGARRRSGAEGTVPSGAVRPGRMNPFTMFSSYPTRALDKKMKFALIEGTHATEADRRLAAESFSKAANILLKRESVGEVIKCLETVGTPLSLQDLSGHLPQISQDMLARILIVLTKCGMLTALAATAARSPKSIPASV